MNHFAYRRGVLHAEDVALPSLARQVGTPTYVYARATLERHVGVLRDAFASVPHRLCYSVKANPTLAVLGLFADLGCGFDVVSEGELRRVQAAGGAARDVVFSGVGKQVDEMAHALDAGILMFNVESAEELEALDAVGRRLKKKAPFSLRVNPDVDARTHRHIATGLRTSKFGVPLSEAAALYRKSRALKGVTAVGVDCHIGSQVTEPGPVRTAIGKVARFYRALVADGFALQLLDVGGGLGITYSSEAPPTPEEYARTILDLVAPLGTTLLLEPGRVLVGNAGLLLTRVLYRKENRGRKFVVVDAGMNDLLRPALYDAHHEIRPVLQRRGPRVKVDIVGPICESGDFLGKQRALVLPRQDELLAVMTAGAYGMSMSSNYNSRRRPAEVLVDGNAYRVVRERETYSALWKDEHR